MGKKQKSGIDITLYIYISYYIHIFPIKKAELQIKFPNMIVWRCWTSVPSICHHAQGIPELFRCLYFLGLSKVRSKMKQQNEHLHNHMGLPSTFCAFICKQDFGMTLKTWEKLSQVAISSLAEPMTKTQVLRTLGWPCRPEGAVDVCPCDHSAEHYEIYNLYKHVMSQ